MTGGAREPDARAGLHALPLLHVDARQVRVAGAPAVVELEHHALAAATARAGLLDDARAHRRERLAGARAEIDAAVEREPAPPVRRRDDERRQRRALHGRARGRRARARCEAPAGGRPRDEREHDEHEEAAARGAHRRGTTTSMQRAFMGSGAIDHSSADCGEVKDFVCVGTPKGNFCALRPES
jgi:hypothetical protein